MSQTFSAVSDPDSDLVEALSAAAPANPFRTHEYVRFRRSLGFRPWAFSVDDDAESGCLGFVLDGRLERTLDVPSLPSTDAPAFWRDLELFCRRYKIDRLNANSFASAKTAIPRLAAETSRRARREYLIDLRLGSPLKPTSSNHVRNIKRARAAGVVIREGTDRAACGVHARLIAMSMDRRQDRGEAVQETIDVPNLEAIAASGAGRLYQAARNDEILSSIMILQAPRGGYYHSAGTSADGMSVGASHMLVAGVADTLASQGIATFNLGGGNDPDSGLDRFKIGFGARAVDLEAVVCVFSSPLRKALVGGIRRVRDALRTASSPSRRTS